MRLRERGNTCSLHQVLIQASGLRSEELERRLKEADAAKESINGELTRSFELLDEAEQLRKKDADEIGVHFLA